MRHVWESMFHVVRASDDQINKHECPQRVRLLVFMSKKLIGDGHMRCLGGVHDSRHIALAFVGIMIDVFDVTDDQT